MKERKETKEPEEIFLDEINVIMKIPKNAYRIKVECDVIDDHGEHHQYLKYLLPENIMQARQDFLDNVDGGDDYDARYVITEKGIEWLKQLEKERNDEVHSVCD